MAGMELGTLINIQKESSKNQNNNNCNDDDDDDDDGDGNFFDRCLPIHINDGQCIGARVINWFASLN